MSQQCHVAAGLYPKMKLSVLCVCFWQELLGYGSYSRCLRCIHRATGGEYAVKIINKGKSVKDVDEEVEVRRACHCRGNYPFFEGLTLSRGGFAFLKGLNPFP